MTFAVGFMTGCVFMCVLEVVWFLIRHRDGPGPNGSIRVNHGRIKELIKDQQ